MICRDIIETIEETYPVSVAMEWDNVGLLVGTDEKEVKRIYLAVDATDEVIQHAVAWKADLLITHHPMIFSPMKKITNMHFIGKRILTLIRHDIAYYAMHTNYDVLRMGALAAEKLGVSEVEILEPTMPDAGIGVIGRLEGARTLAQCGALVKEVFGTPSLKVFGEADKEVKRIAILPGSGKSAVGAAVEKGADVFLTGDIEHHEGIDALAQGLAIIDAGHYGLEHIFMEDMKQFLLEQISDMEVETEAIAFPFQVWN